MKKLTILFLGLLFISKISAHDFYDECFDPAKDVLDKLKSKYTTSESVTIDFSLIINLAERPETEEKGRLVQQGESFKVEMEQQDIYCDGNDLWYHLKEQKEVQINDYEGGEDVGVISPADLLNQYETGAFEYALVKDYKKNGQTYNEIEFKPNDEFSDYSKLRAVINVNDLKITEVLAFGKDGSRFKMTLDKEQFDLSYQIAFFQWNEKDFPGVVVEDLRLD